MEYLIGVGLALLVCVFAMLVGFDRDRAFYPTMVIVVATYYILFAVMGSSMPALELESAAAVAFLVLAVVGFRKNLWLIVAALAGHGIFDFFHHWFIQNPGVPEWWPGFCLSYDVLAGAFLAMLLLRRRSGFRSKI
jgi:hydrogenase/urease accessory protein HupE